MVFMTLFLVRKLGYRYIDDFSCVSLRMAYEQ